MLEIFTASSEKQLIRQFLSDWKKNSTDFFEERWLVINNHASKSWLRQVMADNHGACAGVRFMQVGSLVWETLLAAGIEIPAYPQFDTRVLRWRVAACQLQEEAVVDLSILNRAKETARIMDRYLHYRPEWMKEWQTRPDESDEVALCWHQVVKNFGNQHPDALLDEIAPGTDADSMLKKSLPPSIWFFNPQQFSPVQLKALAIISRLRPVFMYLTNPVSEEFWFDIKDPSQQMYEKHHKSELYEYYDRDGFSPLLEQLGRQKADMLNCFLEQEHLFSGISWRSETAGERAEEDLVSLAHSICDDLANNRSDPALCPADDSVRVHACHSRRRELEVARDDILDALQNTSIRPEEVLVLAPDINDYSEWIEPVFSVPVTGPEEHKETRPVLHWHIDRLRVEDRLQAGALLALLTVLQDRLSAPEVMDLLLHEPIRAAFGIAQADISMVEDWVRRSRIYWGRDASHRQKLGFTATDSNTWTFGQERWIGGLLLGEDDPDLDVLETHGDLEGQQAVFSGLFVFLRRLKEAHKQWQDFFEAPLSPAGWYEWLVDLMERFFSEESLSSDDIVVRRLHKALVVDTQHTVLRLSPEVIVNLVRETLSDQEYRSAGRIGVRFQSWENACLGPARMVFVLGMNAGEFPANEPLSERDKTKHEPRPLDRNRRLRDKNLLLNLLSEGVERVAFSYLGFSASDNETLPPSPVLEHLVEYLQQKTAGKSPSFSVTKHRMHGFYPDYFQLPKKRPQENPSGLFSYHPGHLRQARHLLGERVIRQPDKIGKVFLDGTPESVDLKQMSDFFCDPLLYFLRHCLPVKLDSHGEALPDRETWQLKGLDLYLAEELLLTRRPRDTQLARKILFLSGLLPDTATGRIQASQVADRMVEQVIKPSDSLGLHSCDVKWQGGTAAGSRNTQQVHRITGEVTVTADGTLVSVCVGTSQKGKEFLPRPKDILRHWLSHVFCSPDKDSWLVSPSHYIRFGPLAEPQSMQQAILSRFTEGQQRPWLVLPDVAISVSKNTFRMLDAEGYRNALLAAADLDYKRHLRLFMPLSRDKTDEAYQQIKAVLGPLFEHGRMQGRGLRDGFRPGVTE